MPPGSITAWLNKFTAASMMIANGVDLVTTTAELEHATPTTTANIYAKSPRRSQLCPRRYLYNLSAGRTIKRPHENLNRPCQVDQENK